MMMFHKVSICLGAFCAAVSCATMDDTSAPDAVVSGMFEAFNRHDAEAVAAFYAEDGTLMSPEMCEPIVGREAVAANYRALFTEIPDVQDTILDMIVHDDRVAVQFVARSELEGAAFELPIAAILVVRDGLVVSDVAYFDAANPPTCE